ncbi:hypothetical protein ACOI1C_02990 [Bacillus sp. DJP31]|uniref:hypothetical protein n=1 Tax=Bacillus sp. DJP31 TaxID=3409789 RepID=UPI003BB5A607
MVPFHLLLFSIFSKKKETEVTFDEYQNGLVVEQLREKSKDFRYTMNQPFI